MPICWNSREREERQRCLTACRWRSLCCTWLYVENPQHVVPLNVLEYYFAEERYHEAFRGLGISRFHCRKEATGPKGSCFSECSGSQCWDHLTSWRFSLLYVYICVLERISHHDCSLLSLQPQKAQTHPSLFRSKHRSRYLGGRRKLSFVFLAIHTFLQSFKGNLSKLPPQHWVWCLVCFDLKICIYFSRR